MVVGGCCGVWPTGAVLAVYSVGDLECVPEATMTLLSLFAAATISGLLVSRGAVSLYFWIADALATDGEQPGDQP